MFWIVLAVVCLILVIVGIVIHVLNEWDDVGILMALIFGIILLVLLICIPVVAIADRQNVTVFKLHKEYIESHVPVDSIENAALTNKKIELNDWLFGAQYAKEHYGIFTFYPDEVITLQPIK